MENSIKIENEFEETYSVKNYRPNILCEQFNFQQNLITYKSFRKITYSNKNAKITAIFKKLSKIKVWPNLFIPFALLNIIICSIINILPNFIKNCIYGFNLDNEFSKNIIKVDICDQTQTQLIHYKNKKVDNKKCAIIAPGLNSEGYEYQIQVIIKSLYKYEYDFIVITHRGSQAPYNDDYSSCNFFQNLYSKEAQIKSMDYIDKNLNQKSKIGVGTSLGGSALGNQVGRSQDSTQNYDNILDVLIIVNSPLKVKGHLLMNYYLDRAICSKVKEYFNPKWDDFKSRYISDKSITQDNQTKDIQTMKEFDNKITSKILGCKDEDEYQEWAESQEQLKKVKIPTLIIDDDNDMVTDGRQFRFGEIEEQQESVIQVRTQAMGHLSGLDMFGNFTFGNFITQFVQGLEDNIV